MDPADTPRIETDGIHISWSDGHEGYYPHWYLRAACQCADCLEGSGYSRMDFFENIPQDIRALDWCPVGRYAVEFLWSDGHETGAYAFETMRRICRCGECVARAAASARARWEDMPPGGEKRV